MESEDSYIGRLSFVPLFYFQTLHISVQRFAKFQHALRRVYQHA